MRWKLGVEYAGRTDLFARALVRNQFGQYEGSVSKVVACVGFLVHFYVGAGLMRCARNSALFRHLGFTSWATMPAGGTSVAMIYATLAGLTESATGRLHWTFCTEALQIQHRSPLTEVLHVQMALGCCLAKEDPIPDWTTLTATASEEENVLRGKLYRSIIAISESIEHAPQYLYTRHAEAQAVLRQIMNGARALAAFWQGKLEEALEFATRTIHKILSIDRDILSVWTLVSNAYAVQIAIVFLNRELFKLGMSYIAEAGMGFPVTHRILSRLSEQFTHAEQESSRYQLMGHTASYPFQLPGLSPSSAPSGLLASAPSTPVNHSSPLASPSSPHALSHINMGSFPSSPVHGWTPTTASGGSNILSPTHSPINTNILSTSPNQSSYLNSVSGAASTSSSSSTSGTGSSNSFSTPVTPMNPQSPSEHLLYATTASFSLDPLTNFHRAGMPYYSSNK